MNDGKYVKKRVPSYTIGGNVNWCSYYRKQCGGSLKADKESPCEPITSAYILKRQKLLLKMIPAPKCSQQNHLTIAKTCPWTDEWIKKIWGIHIHAHTHNGISSAIKKNEIMPLKATRIGTQRLSD